jgi:CheY-like chemotaxis protein
MTEAITILVADDEVNVRIALRDLLSDHGYRVAEASSSDEAFSKAVELRPDLVVLDVNMPPEDGYAVCRAIRDNNVISRTPILMLTCHGLVEERTAGLQWGADDYVIKPCHNDELLARIEALFRRFPPRARFHERLEFARAGIEAVEEYRRYIVVFNIDVAGSSMIPPTIREEYHLPLLFKDYRALVDAAVIEEGGSEVAWAGDGGTAEFAEPEQAVAAAITILDKRASHPRVSNLVLRIGVACGTELLEPDSQIGRRTSQTHNRAGHLQKFSGPNTITIDSGVLDALSDRSLFRVRQPINDNAVFELITSNE